MTFNSSLLTKVLIGVLVGIVLVGGVVGSRLFLQPSSSKEKVSPGITAIQEVPATVGSSVVEERVRNLETSLAEVVSILKTTTGKTISTTTSSSLDSRVKTLETSVADLQSRVKVLESGSKATTSNATTTKSPDYIRLGMTGSTTATDWTSVGSTEASVSGGDYSGYTSMRFEVSLKTSNSSGRAYVRLFNKDDNSPVTASEVSTDVTSNTWSYSGTFTLPATRKTYYLQMKSQSGVGAQVSDAQIRVNY